jgi:acylphosphatase
MADKRLHLIIHGLVQGVFFRANTREEGQRLGLSGWVRNRADGTVEVVAEGPEETLDQLEQWSHRGPPSARVDRVETRWEEPTRELSGFGVR